MKRGLRIGLVLALAAFVGGGVSFKDARAGLVTCNDSQLRPFAPWGDYSYYKLAPNGSFDEGSNGWALSRGARVVSEGNPLISGSSSLLLPEGSSATAPAACAKLADPASRFFFRNTGSRDGALRVDVTYRTLLGLFTVTSRLGTFTADGEWQPSPKYGHLVSNVLGLLALNPKIAASLRFKFTPVGRDAEYQIDDLFVDPLLQI
jgi:hypothetical protein